MASGEVTIALVGDLFINRTEEKSIFAHAAPYLREVDIVIGNLEGPITDVGEETQAKEAGKIRAGEEMLAEYTYAGFNVLGMANNHGMNRGVAGVLRCIELLEGAGIAHAGAGGNLQEARAPAIVERNGARVAVLSYTSVFAPALAATADRGGMATVRVGTSYEPQTRHIEVPGSPPIIHTQPDPADKAAMLDDVRKAKEQADVVVVTWHWGLSGSTGKYDAGKVIGYQVELAHGAVDAGADLIVGHHPHRLEGIEVYKGKVIFYSLGNFAMVSHWQGIPQQTIIARCLVRDGRVAEVGFKPTQINALAQPVPLDPSQGQDIIATVQRLSEEFNTHLRAGEHEVALETESAVPVG